MNLSVFTVTSLLTPSVPVTVVVPALKVPEMAVLPVEAATVKVRPVLGPKSTSPSTMRVPLDTVLPLPPATVNLSVAIASDPSLAVTTNFADPMSTSLVTSRAPVMVTCWLAKRMVLGSPSFPIDSPVKRTDSTST